MKKNKLIIENKYLNIKITLILFIKKIHKNGNMII